MGLIKRAFVVTYHKVWVFRKIEHFGLRSSELDMAQLESCTDFGFDNFFPKFAKKFEFDCWNFTSICNKEPEIQILV